MGLHRISPKLEWDATGHRAWPRTETEHSQKLIGSETETETDWIIHHHSETTPKPGITKKNWDGETHWGNGETDWDGEKALEWGNTLGWVGVLGCAMYAY